jgi:hypothetical protein
MRISLVRALVSGVVFLSACRPASTPTYNTGQALGIYEGRFGNGLLILTLNYINGDIVSGYMADRGVRRNINGSVLSDGAYLDFEVKEPGDGPQDGRFSFKFDTTRQQISGDWRPLGGGEGSPKAFFLKRQNLDLLPPNLLGESWDLGRDSSVTFKPNGRCTYALYENPEDTKSQLNSIPGNYIFVGDTLLIDWQKNPYTPAQEMQLRVTKQLIDAVGATDSIIVLKGNGWSLSQSRAG